MKEETQVLHPLAVKYDELSRDKQKYYQDAWKLATGSTRQNFNKRMKRPYLIDLAIWQRVFNELLLKDEIYKHYAPVIKAFKILPYDSQTDLFPTPKPVTA